MTISIVARCKETGQFGMSVASSSAAVAARCMHARAGVGAVATQNITDPSLGPKCLNLMEGGKTAKQAVSELVKSDANIAYRQLTAIGRTNKGAAFSGEHSLGTFGEFIGDDVVCAGNLLADEKVLDVMGKTFEAKKGHLGDRLLAGMRAALEAGGEVGPVYSAGLVLVDNVSWPIADLRFDWDGEGEPVERIAEAWRVYKPQLDDYVMRAVDPGNAPNFGVPGESD